MITTSLRARVWRDNDALFQRYIANATEVIIPSDLTICNVVIFLNVQEVAGGMLLFDGSQVRVDVGVVKRNMSGPEFIAVNFE